MDRKAQAKEVYDMIKKAEDLSIFFKNKKPMFIISMNWFKKWKKYCFFHHNTGDHSDKKEELKTFNNEINDTLKSDEEDEKTEVHSHVHPGTIDQKELLELDEEIFIDPDEENNYANDVMKKGLEENKDYIIVNERVWEYLSTFYQGKEIRRIVINVNEKNYFMVEVWLKKV